MGKGKGKGSKMEKQIPVTKIVFEKLNDFANSTHDFAHGILNRFNLSPRRRPIEILKRLQRDAFSEIMKLRDRQEKVERVLTLSKFSKGGSPFQDSSTRVRGKVNVLGGLLFLDDVDDQIRDAIERSGIRTGIDARLAFETGVREKDTLLAEFVAGETLGGPLSLAKVFYEAHVTDWFSAVAIPMGAHCRDVAVPTSSHQERGLTDYSEFGPPLLNQHNGSAIGIKVKKSNIVTSLAQFINSSGLERSFSTFGQIAWQLSGSTNLSLLGVHREVRPLNQNINLGALSLPISLVGWNKLTEAVEENSPTINENRTSDGSIALSLNTEFDDNTRIGGWIETKNSNPKHLHWGVTMRDTPEDELGWGLTMGGLLQGPQTFEHFQVETFLNVNVGKKFILQPSLMFVKDGATQFPSLMLRSSWSL